MITSFSTIVVSIVIGWIASTIVVNKVLSEMKKGYSGEKK